jgi:hypothetical protein
MVADVRAMIGGLPQDCSFHGSHGSMGHFDPINHLSFRVCDLQVVGRGHRSVYEVGVSARGAGRSPSGYGLSLAPSSARGPLPPSCWRVWIARSTPLRMQA